jgi:hypothetical protein
MRPNPIPWLAVAVVLTACVDAPLLPLAPAEPNLSAAGHAVPLKGRVAGVSEHVPNPAVCGFEALHATLLGTGHATQIGSFAATLTHCFGADISGGAGELVAASGAKIFFTYAGGYELRSSGLLDVHMDFVLAGGTGRFAGVSGEARVEGVVDATTDPRTFAATIDGYLVAPRAHH